MKQQLVEVQAFNITKNSLNEGKSSTGNALVEGILATAEVKNGNGRYYSKKLWEREIDKYKELVKDRRAVGELDHPDSTVINLKNVSHNIADMWWDGNNVMGKIEILPTPSGNILKSLIDNGIVVGVSSRGMGWDFVSTPSNPDSFMHLVTEGLDFSTQTNYTKVNSIITEILCAKGFCPIK